MSYTRSASVQKFIDSALTKLLIYFHDGNKRTQYGRHNFKSERPAKNPRAVELRRHERAVANNADFIRVAIIYDNTTGEEIRRFKRGAWL